MAFLVALRKLFLKQFQGTQTIRDCFSLSGIIFVPTTYATFFSSERQMKELKDKLINVRDCHASMMEI